MKQGEKTDVLILGAGAAGLFCAGVAARRGRRVVVIDHARRLGEKIRISGGGRCNFTNLNADIAHFISDNPRFALSALKRFGPRDFLSLIEENGIPWREKAAGQLFCARSARDIIDMLLRRCQEGGVEILPGVAVKQVGKMPEGGFQVQTSGGVYRASSLVIATGGLSVPKIGASDFGYRIARQFALPVVPVRPGLVPLTFAESLLAHTRPLSGIALKGAGIACGRVRFQDDILFTHRGLSGPAVLQISSYWRPGREITVDLCPGTDIAGALLAAKRQRPRSRPAAVLSRFLPRRLGEFCCDGLQQPLGEIADKRLRKLGDAVNMWRILPSGSEGYRTAEVTVGGVDTRALSSKTMETRDVPGLYFIGEVVDVTGHLGGYNFQWAWSSAHAAGQFV